MLSKVLRCCITTMIIIKKLSFLGICAGFFLLARSSVAADILEPNTTSKLEAVQMATNNMWANDCGTNKMILLIVSDTNQCTACISLEFGILPSSKVRNFIAESFVYWACGPEQQCREYSEYTGTGTLPIPLTFVINPYSPKGVYQYMSSGADAASTYFEWLSKALLKATAPRVTSVSYPASGTVVVKGASISTNVPLRTVKYRLNSGAWTSASIPSGTFASAFELPALALTPGITNTLYLYALDSSGAYRTRTNVLSLPYSAPAPSAVVTVSPGRISVPLDATVQFSHTATNVGPQASYQWKKGGVNLPGATRPSLIIENVGASSGGLYQLEVQADGKTLVSSPAQLWVIGKPQIARKGPSTLELAAPLFGPATTEAYFETSPEAGPNANWQKAGSSTLTQEGAGLVIRAQEAIAGSTRYFRAVVK